MDDFIALAQSSHAIVRLLTEASGGSISGSNEEDDDFADLENISRDHDGLVPLSPSSSFAPDEQAPSYESSSSVEAATASSSIPFINTNHPLLSPTAEQELLSLSTNFLLYTAMVVIVTLVAQIYFPSCLEPREPITLTTTSGSTSATTRARGGSTRKMDSVREEEGFDFMDDEEEEDEEEDDDDVEGRRSGGGRGQLDLVVEGDDEDKEIDDDDEVAGLLLNHSSTSTSTTIPSSPMGPSRAGSRLFMREENNNSSFLQELMDERNKKKSRESVYTNLAICAIMLNLTFVSWGLLQVMYFDVFDFSFALLHTFVPSCHTLIYLISLSLIIVGTDAYPSLSASYRRIFHVLLRARLHQSILDTHHVGNASLLL